MATSSRNYIQADREKLADELVELVTLWRTSKWLTRWSVGHVILTKVWYRLDLITECLRGGEGK
jgi:hypothetical protein